MEIPQEIQARIDRIAALAAERRGNLVKGEGTAIKPRSQVPAFFSSKGDLFPQTPIITEISPSERAGARLDRSASRPRANIASHMPEKRVRPDRAALRSDWLEIAEIERTEPETLSEKHRRRLMRHLRLACWCRGLDQVATRRVAGAIGWEAQRLRKATTRKYLLIAGIQWVLASSPAILRGSTAHFLGMVKVVRELSAGTDLRELPPRRRAGQLPGAT